MIVQPVGQFKQFVNGGAGVGLAAVRRWIGTHRGAADRRRAAAYGYIMTGDAQAARYAIPAKPKTLVIHRVRGKPVRQLTFGDGPARLYASSRRRGDFATTTSLPERCGCDIASYGDVTTWRSRGKRAAA